jgi:hypothetical protein
MRSLEGLVFEPVQKSTPTTPTRSTPKGKKQKKFYNVEN